MCIRDRAMRASRLGISAGGWRPPSHFGADILKIGGNELFSELYLTFDFYNKLTFFTEECPYFSEHFLRGSVSVTGAIIDILKGKYPLVKHEQLSNVYQKLTDSIESTLKYLSRCV